MVNFEELKMMMGWACNFCIIII